MDTVHEPAREVPVVADADVVVCGGGPGGLPAAIAAARTGASTVLVERHGFLGGLATAGLVAPILGHNACKSNTPIVAGILKETVDRMHALDGAPAWEEALGQWGIRFDAEAFKKAAEEMVQEAGVDLLLHTFVVDAVTENDRITDVIVESKSGRQALRGRVFIDATGDADVAFRAGAETRQGRDFDGKVQSIGSFFHIGGVPELDDDQRKQITDIVRKALEDGTVHSYHPGVASVNTYHTDRFSPNMTRCPGDSTNVRDLTRAELTVRKQAWDLVGVLRTVPGCEGAYVHVTSAQAGPRESRQVMGGYVLTGEDVRTGAKFDDAVTRGSWWVDIHCPLGRTHPVHLCVKECAAGESCEFWASEHENMFAREELYPPEGDWYDIPYRSLVANKINNLLVSGRCISATHEAMAGARVMGTCMGIGQAAGTASAMAVETGVAPRDLDAAKLRAQLKADGALV